MSDFIIENIKQLNKDVIKEILQYKGDNQQELFETARNVRNNGKWKTESKTY